jgi:hypothetical protein
MTAGIIAPPGVFFFFSLSLGVGWDWVHLPRRPIFGQLYQPRMIDDECGVVGGMRIGKGNRSTRRKPPPVPLRPPQISHDLTWNRTRAAAVGSRRLTAWAMARPAPPVTLTESLPKTVLLARSSDSPELTQFDYPSNCCWIMNLYDQINLEANCIL